MKSKEAQELTRKYICELIKAAQTVNEDELVHVEGDLFRTKEPFHVYEKENTSAIGELNWNTSSDEFAYREIYINNKQEGATK